MEDSIPRGPNGEDLRAEVVHPLIFPIERVFRGSDGERIEAVAEVTVKRLKGAAIKKLQRTPQQDQEVTGILLATGLSDKDFDKLDILDIQAIGEIVSGFVGPGPQTGPTSSET